MGGSGDRSPRGSSRGSVSGAGAGGEIRLAPGAAPVERPLAAFGARGARGARTFVADLAAGKPYLLAVEQQGIDAIVALRLPGEAGETLLDGSQVRWGEELALLRPAAAGPCRIAVRSARQGVAAGRIAVRLMELSEAAGDRERLAGLAEVTAAGAALAGQPDGREKARAAFQAARDHFRAAGDRRDEAVAVAALADLAHRLGHRREAVQLYRDALARWQDLGLPEREIQCWSDLSLTLWELGELPAAAEAVERGMALVRRRGGGGGVGGARKGGNAAGAGSAGNAGDMAMLRSNQCLVLHARGETGAALACYREALAMFARLRESGAQAAVLNSIGYAHFNLGEPRQAEEAYRRALPAWRQAGDRQGEAQTLNNLAVLYRSLGELDGALDYYGQARRIFAALGDAANEAAALSNLGVAYGAAGETERARLFLTRALELRRQAEDRRGEAVTLNALGSLARRGGAAEQAIALHRQALQLAVATGDPRAEGISRSNLGEACAAAGAACRSAEALAELDRALSLLRQVGDRFYEILALRRKGAVLAAAGLGAEALPVVDEALSLARAAGDRPGEAAALTVRARALRGLGDLDAARDSAAAAVAAIEGLRSGLGNPDLRASFLAVQREAYELQVDILVRLDAAHPGQGFARAALAASEQARARALLDLVRESGAALRRGIAPALAARRRDLERRLALKADRRQSLLARGQGGAAEARALELAIEQLAAELDGLDGEIARRSPRYADLTLPVRVSVPDLLAQLDPATLLLEYFLGEERSFLFVAGAGALQVHVLPPRAAVEAAARDYHAAVSTPPDLGGGGRGQLGAALGEMLLGPAAGALHELRLAVVADGALHYVPFAALPEPGAGGAPLVAQHEVVELPSAAVLAAERRELARRPRAPRLGIVLADPVFRRDDPRVQRVPRVARVAGDARGAGRQGDEASLPGLPGEPGEAEEPIGLGRLRFSRQEALAIAALGPPGAVETALDFAASRELAVSGRLRRYRYIHFATHGLLDAERPALSGLALSGVDRAGRPREGFLRLRDIYDLDLDADLVVLSGCQTALGKEIAGEGLVGLTRGFLYAGAPRVVASLWWVDDQASALLMARFYRGLWRDRLPAAAALRQASRSLAADRRFRDPFYWAAFVLQGDWR